MMKRRSFFTVLISAMAAGRNLVAAVVERKIRVPLKEAHRGTLEVDTRLLDSYGGPPASLRQFYFDARSVFESDSAAEFSHQAIVESASRHGIDLMGGPLLGDLSSEGVTFWMRAARPCTIEVVCGGKTSAAMQARPGEVTRVRVEGLAPGKTHDYRIRMDDEEIRRGSFTTAPAPNAKETFRLAFGSCFHKIGLHNPNLFTQILGRKPHVMMLLGDLAVDDRNNEINMHRADYQLRDVSQPWCDFVSKVPVYAAWDDHDYFDNDLSGVPKRFRPRDRDAVRGVWQENWNNPTNDPDRKGIYFNARVGPVEIIMLDTRSCRDGKRRRQKDSYLGRTQLDWLKKTLAESSAPFKVISSGTMWSDYVSAGKDSWGTWDTESREELFQWVEQEKIGGVLLVSGDRHGARGFRLPRPSGFEFYEFEPATLGGVSGPPGIIKNCEEQLFGYYGTDDAGVDFIAFGEFTFQLDGDSVGVTFRLIRETGEIPLSLDQLTPA